jgi:hypothetical protein
MSFFWKNRSNVSTVNRIYLFRAERILGELLDGVDEL